MGSVTLNGYNDWSSLPLRILTSRNYHHHQNLLQTLHGRNPPCLRLYVGLLRTRRRLTTPGDAWRIGRHTHMAIMSPSKKTVVKPPKGVREQRLMDNISALSEGNDEKRIVAATDIVKFLLSKQKEVSINTSDNMVYFDLKGGFTSVQPC